jgi:ABC-type Mn2+/Zn2+ transport system permease subunit
MNPEARGGVEWAARNFWPIAIATSMIAGFSATSIVRHKRQWWLVTIAAVAAGLLVCTATLLFNTSYRISGDSFPGVLALLMIAAGIPLLSSVAARVVDRFFEEYWVNMIFTLATGTTLLLASPFILVSIACITGDCL